jgi:hypothetical protein
LNVVDLTPRIERDRRQREAARLVCVCFDAVRDRDDATARSALRRIDELGGVGVLRPADIGVWELLRDGMAAVDAALAEIGI